MELKRDFGVIFKDRNWLKKTLLGGFFFMLPVVDLLSFGFLARLIHSKLGEGGKELPSWKNWGDLFLKGLTWGVIIILYFAVPLLILSLLPESVLTFLVNPEFVLSHLNLGGYLWFSLSGLLAFVVLFFLPMALIIFANTDSFREVFHLKKVFVHIKKNFSSYIIAYILTIIFLGIDFFLHILLNRIHFGIIPSYFLFVWVGFIISLISASLFVESF